VTHVWRCLVLVVSVLALAGCGRVAQSQACERFVECVQALDARRGNVTNVARYEPAGPCWGSGEAAELCTGSCERGIVVLQQSYPGLECRGAP